MAESKFDTGRQVGGRVSKTIYTVVVFLVTGFGLYGGFRRGGAAELPVSIIIFLAIAAFVATCMFLYRALTLSDLRKVQRDHPDDLVFAARVGDKRAFTGPAAAGRTALGSFPNSFAVVVDSRGVGIWGGSREPQLKYFLHWVDIMAIVPTEIDQGAYPMTGLAIDARFSDVVLPVQIVVMRRPFGFFRRAEFDALQLLAAAAEAKRPVVARA